MSDEGEAKPKRKRLAKKNLIKALITLVVLLLIVGLAYKAGNKNNSNSTASSSDLRNSSSNPYQKAAAKSSKNSASSTKRELPPSNGRISLSGTVTDINDKQISIKTGNGDTKTFSLSDKTRVYSSNSKEKSQKPSDIKKDSKANIMVSIDSQGNFNVQLIRVY